MSKTADIAIIGGGVIGCSIALNLAERGKKVVLIERGDFAAGATGSCDQMIIMQSKNPGIHLKLALESAKLYREMPARYIEEIEFFGHGGMILIENETEMAVMRDFVRRQKETGLDVEIIDRATAAKRQRGLAEHLLGAAYSPQDAHVNPYKMNLLFAREATKLGAEFMLHTDVTGFKTQGKRVTGIVTSNGEIDAETVVIAAGAWSPTLCEKLGLEAPIKPRRGQIVVTEPVAPYIVGDILSAQYIVAKYNPDALAGSDSRAVQLGVGLALSQSAKGNILIGATREFVGYDLSNTREGIREVLKNAARLVPGLRDINVIRVMSGVRPYTPDGLPMLGRFGDMEGIFIAAGHEGDGIALAPVTGKLAGELICGDKPSIDISALNPDRFARNKA